MYVPFVIYADCKPNNDASYTEAYQKQSLWLL